MPPDTLLLLFSLCWRDVQLHADTPAYAKINLCIQKFVHLNKYYKQCIVHGKIVFTIIFLIQKILIIINTNLHNKNFHNNELHKGLVTVHFLEVWLKFKYSWNITKGRYKWIIFCIIVEMSFSHIYVNWNLIFHE